MAEKKYKLTGETISFDGANLYRIEALKDFYDVKKGDKGGWVEHYGNLSHLGDCWVYHNAIVMGNAVVKGDARVMDHAEISGNAIIDDNARVCGCATICDSVVVNEDAHILDHAVVYGHAQISGNANIYDHAGIFGYAKVCERSSVHDYSRVFGTIQICGNANICGNAIIRGNAIIKSTSDYIVFKNWWSSGRCFTWTRSNNMWSVGCFYGTGEELIAKAYKDSELSGREYERVVNYVNSILKDIED